MPRKRIVIKKLRVQSTPVRLRLTPDDIFASKRDVIADSAPEDRSSRTKQRDKKS